MQTAVDPVGLALVSQRQYPHRFFSPQLLRPPVAQLSGLNGFWSDLWDRGQQAIDEWADSQIASLGTDAHIAAQNQAVADMGAILNQYHSGAINNALAQQQIQATASGFARFCQQLGYPEALQGASEVSALAARIISDLRREAGITALPSALENPWVIGGVLLALGLMLPRLRSRG